MIIVNADDLGCDARTNAAIIQSFERQLCSSATLMANMPGFEDACELIHAHGLENCVGFHLNLSEGTPLIDEIRRSPRFCDAEGNFRLLRQERILWLGTEERSMLAREVRAQIQRLKSKSLRITHMDSHKNIHEELAIFTTVVPLAKEAGIPYVRLTRNIGKASSLVKGSYRSLINYRLQQLGLSRTRYFGSIMDYDEEHAVKQVSHIDESCEIMVHPCFGANGELIDLCSQNPLDVTIGKYNSLKSAVSYSGYKYGREAGIAKAGKRIPTWRIGSAGMDARL